MPTSIGVQGPFRGPEKQDTNSQCQPGRTSLGPRQLPTQTAKAQLSGRAAEGLGLRGAPQREKAVGGAPEPRRLLLGRGDAQDWRLGLPPTAHLAPAQRSRQVTAGHSRADSEGDRLSVCC